MEGKQPTGCISNSSLSKRYFALKGLLNVGIRLQQITVTFFLLPVQDLVAICKTADIHMIGNPLQGKKA